MKCRCVAICSSPGTGKERIQNEHGLKLHPTQKPEALLHRVLLASTNQEDVVLDPFAGTGTTAAMARRLRRHFLGIEAIPAYAEAAIGRVQRELAALSGGGNVTANKAGKFCEFLSGAWWSKA